MFPKIVVIIPVYNGFKYIDRCINSVLSQDYKNLEVIAVDDGSVDESGPILDKWAKRDQRVHVIHTGNHGVSSARNIGLRYANTISSEGYIHFIDIDDELTADCYHDIMSRMFRAANEEKEPDIIIFGYTTHYIDRNDISIGSGVSLPKQDEYLSGEDVKNKYFDFYGIRTGLRNPVWNKLYLNKICNRLVFNEKLKQAEDLFFNIDAFELANSIMLVSKSYYQYNKSVEEKGYYDSDVQMAYDRNKYICDRIIKIGVNPESAVQEYYHKIIDSAYDYCMLVLRTKPDKREKLINDALCKLRNLDLPSKISNLTPQQKVVIFAMKLRNKYIQYIFLQLVRIGVEIVKYQ